MAFSPPRGRQPSIEWVLIDELLIDDSYQRSVDTKASQALIRAIASEWDWDVLDVLKVSRRPDDRLFLVDGQHRRAAAALRGDIPQLPCVLKRCSGANEEARLFIASNRGRKRMSRLDDFRAAIAAGDAEAVVIERLVTAAELSIASQELHGHLKAGQLMNVGSLRSLLRIAGETRLGEALRVIGEAFPDEVIYAPTALLGAVLDLLAGGMDPDRLFQALLAGTTVQWAEWANLRENRGGATQRRAMRDIIRHRASGLAVAGGPGLAVAA